jgi:uncharacterized membrane protein
MKLISRTLLILAVVILIFGLTFFIDRYTNRPSCVGLSAPHYYDLEDNLGVLGDLLMILFIPAVLFMTRHIIIKKTKG